MFYMHFKKKKNCSLINFQWFGWLDLNVNYTCWKKKHVNQAMFYWFVWKYGENMKTYILSNKIKSEII